MPTGDDTPGMVRCFVALALPPACRQLLARALQRLRRIPARVSWVAPDKIHLTLAFLGDVPGETIPFIAARLEAVAAGFPPFTFPIAGLGFFGARRSLRVIWADIPGPNVLLREVQQAVAHALSEMNLAVETREFVPHITLGRVRAARNADQLAEAIEATQDTDFGEAAIDAILLMRSDLNAEGTHYTELHAAALNPDQRV